MLLMTLPFTPTRIVFFTGKGGVGKTSLACATAVALADAGRRVLLVSTDPASNLDEVLGVGPVRHTGGDPCGAWALRVEHRPRGGGSGLSRASRRARCAARCRPRSSERSRSNCRARAPPRSPRSTSSRACWLTRRRPTAFDHVIFDTAPTGHTLRLLKLPGAWEGFLATNTSGTSCLGPLSGLQAQRGLYQASLATLGDGHVTTVALVSRLDPAALAEAERTRAELAAIGILNQRLFINGVFRATDRDDAVAMALEQRGVDARREMADGLASLPRHDVALREWAPLGVARLRALFSDSTPADVTAAREPRADVPEASLASLIDACESSGHGVIMTMGKGGVGRRRWRPRSPWNSRGVDMTCTSPRPIQPPTCSPQWVRRRKACA